MVWVQQGATKWSQNHKCSFRWKPELYTQRHVTAGNFQDASFGCRFCGWVFFRFFPLFWLFDGFGGWYDWAFSNFLVWRTFQKNVSDKSFLQSPAAHSKLLSPQGIHKFGVLLVSTDKKVQNCFKIASCGFVFSRLVFDPPWRGKQTVLLFLVWGWNQLESLGTSLNFVGKLISASCHFQTAIS